jgi:hypothetical protein
LQLFLARPEIVVFVLRVAANDVLVRADNSQMLFVGQLVGTDHWVDIGQLEQLGGQVVLNCFRKEGGHSPAAVFLAHGENVAHHLFDEVKVELGVWEFVGH